jgi:hypothetical protein
MNTSGAERAAAAPRLSFNTEIMDGPDKPGHDYLINSVAYLALSQAATALWRASGTGR